MAQDEKDEGSENLLEFDPEGGTHTSLSPVVFGHISLKTTTATINQYERAFLLVKVKDPSL